MPDSPEEEHGGSHPSPPSPSPAFQARRSGCVRQFPQRWRDFEATSYDPTTPIPPVNEEVFERRVEDPVTQEPNALSTPDMSTPSSHRSQLNRFRICRVSAAESTAQTSEGRPDARTPLPHPFRNDSIYEMVKATCLGPSSKTSQGMDALAELFSSGRITAEELSGFKAVTELRHLDEFAAGSPIAGGPWQTGSVRIKMPCPRANMPSFSVEADAPDFEIPGIRYRSLVDLIASKVQDPSMCESFVCTPFTEWWCPPGGTAEPIRVYGEAYSSNIAVRLFEEVKGIPAPVDQPQVENVIVLLMLGSDATHLASFGTASLWPLYVYFGNMSKYEAGRPSEPAASHLAYLPKVRGMCANWPTVLRI